MRFLLCLIFSASAILCFAKSGFLRGYEIDEEAKPTIRSLGRQIYQGIVKKDFDFLNKIRSSKVTPFTFDDSLLNTLLLDREAQLSLVGEFMVKEDLPLSEFQVNDTFHNYRYALNFAPAGEYSYIYLFSVPDRNHQFDLLFSVIFNYENSRLMLAGLSIGHLMYKGMTAPELYEIAKEKAAHHYYGQADYYIKLITAVALPCGKSWHYEKEREMQEFMSKLDITLKEKVPIPLEVKPVPSKPKIVGLNPYPYNGVVYPMVGYSSTIPLNDSIRLKAENDNVHKAIDKIMPGYTSLADTIIYRVINGSSADTFVDFVKPTTRH